MGFSMETLELGFKPCSHNKSTTYLLGHALWLSNDPTCHGNNLSLDLGIQGVIWSSLSPYILNPFTFPVFFCLEFVLLLVFILFLISWCIAVVSSEMCLSPYSNVDWMYLQV